MDEEFKKPAIKPIAINYGVYLSLISIISLVIMYIANIEKSVVLSIITTIITIVIYVYGIKAYKNANNTYLSVGEAIKTGLAIAAVAGVIAAIYALIHYSFIYPEFIDGIREKAHDDMMQRNPNLEGESYDTAVKVMELFTSKGFISTMMLVSSLFFGLIISLIVGLIMKKDDNRY